MLPSAPWRKRPTGRGHIPSSGCTSRCTKPAPHPPRKSPLDGLALALGLLTITPAGASKPLELRTVQVKRVWPPPESALIVIQPGASAINDLAIEEPTVPMDKLDRRATVVLRGQWIAVWPRPRNQISKAEIENASETAFSGQFSTKALEIRTK